jgi:DNA-binding response OmpR family regulator
VARVLVIDDNRDMRDLLRVVLEREGYAVDVAADGEEGLRLQSDRPSDVVITDIFMPNRDGLETVGQLRAQHPRVKVLVISGGGDVVRGTTYLSTAREIGAHAVLRKPFDLPALLDTVRGLFRETNA